MQPSRSSASQQMSHHHETQPHSGETQHGGAGGGMQHSTQIQVCVSLCVNFHAQIFANDSDSRKTGNLTPQNRLSGTNI